MEVHLRHRLKQLVGVIILAAFADVGVPSVATATAPVRELEACEDYVESCHFTWEECDEAAEAPLPCDYGINEPPYICIGEPICEVAMGCSGEKWELVCRF